jgi:hypothetical protein
MKAVKYLTNYSSKNQLLPYSSIVPVPKEVFQYED